MKKYCAVLIALIFVGCKKRVSEQHEQYTLPPIPSCEDQQLFCEEEFDDLPEADEDTGDVTSENIRPPLKQ